MIERNWCAAKPLCRRLHSWKFPQLLAVALLGLALDDRLGYRQVPQVRSPVEYQDAEQMRKPAEAEHDSEDNFGPALFHVCPAEGQPAEAAANQPVGQGCPETSVKAVWWPDEQADQCKAAGGSQADGRLDSRCFDRRFGFGHRAGLSY